MKQEGFKLKSGGKKGTRSAKKKRRKSSKEGGGLCALRGDDCNPPVTWVSYLFSVF